MPVLSWFWIFGKFVEILLENIFLYRVSNKKCNQLLSHTCIRELLFIIVSNALQPLSLSKNVFHVEQKDGFMTNPVNG